MFKIIRKMKESKLNKQKAIALALDVVEDRLSIIDFWKIYLESEIIRNEFRKTQRKHRIMNTESGFVSTKERLERIDVNNFNVRIAICYFCRYFLVANKVTFMFTNSEVKLLEFYEKMRPSWLQTDIPFLDSIIQTAPKNLSKDKIIRYVRQRIKELFITRSHKYPEWLQNPEWPIVDGKPLEFIRQDGDINNYEDITINYYFYNSDTKEEVVIEQFE